MLTRAWDENLNREREDFRVDIRGRLDFGWL